MNRHFLITILNILIGGLLMVLSMDLSLLIRDSINSTIAVFIGAMLIFAGACIGVSAAYGYPLIGRNALGRNHDE